MFTPRSRQAVVTALLDRARSDERLVGAARTGSAAAGAEDTWSDLDLFLGVHPDTPVRDVVAGWSSWLYGDFSAVHHFDLPAGPATYRAFLLADGLEVDLGFTPAANFGPIGDGAFDLVFGAPVAQRASTPDVDHLIGLGWHHALHARTAIARDQPWPAEYWISALRDQAVTLACLRHGLPHSYAKGAGDLPSDTLEVLRRSLATSLDRTELTRALTAAVAAFSAELRHLPSDAVDRVGQVLGELTGTSGRR